LRSGESVAGPDWHVRVDLTLPMVEATSILSGATAGIRAEVAGCWILDHSDRHGVPGRLLAP